MQPSNPPEHSRRQHQRRALRVAAHIDVPGQPPIDVRTIDISVGGMGIAAPFNAPINATCTVRFVLPLPPPADGYVEVRATVAHSMYSGSENAFKVGLTFLDLPAAAEERIRGYVTAMRWAMP
jgi:c-di-GMP-binding flagellar brake protein YcgR